jgi:hypothetical protein
LASENVLQKILQENKFPEHTTEKEKLKIKTPLIRNSAKLIKSKEGVANTDDS